MQSFSIPLYGHVFVVKISLMVRQSSSLWVTLLWFTSTYNMTCSYQIWFGFLLLTDVDVPVNYCVNKDSHLCRLSLGAVMVSTGEHEVLMFDGKKHRSTHSGNVQQKAERTGQWWHTSSLTTDAVTFTVLQWQLQYVTLCSFNLLSQLNLQNWIRVGHRHEFY